MTLTRLVNSALRKAQAIFRFAMKSHREQDNHYAKFLKCYQRLMKTIRQMELIDIALRKVR